MRELLNLDSFITRNPTALFKHNLLLSRLPRKRRRREQTQSRRLIDRDCLLPAAYCLQFRRLFRQNIPRFMNSPVCIREHENQHTDDEEED